MVVQPVRAMPSACMSSTSRHVLSVHVLNIPPCPQRAYPQHPSMSSACMSSTSPPFPQRACPQHACPQHPAMSSACMSSTSRHVLSVHVLNTLPCPQRACPQLPAMSSACMSSKSRHVLSVHVLSVPPCPQHDDDQVILQPLRWTPIYSIKLQSPVCYTLSCQLKPEFLLMVIACSLTVGHFCCTWQQVAKRDTISGTSYNRLG